MKILVIAPTPFFADRGCHVRIYGEIIGLQKLGHEVVLCTYGIGRDMPNISIKRAYCFPWYKKLTAGPSITKIMLLPFLTLTVLKQIKNFNPDVVHAHLHEGAVIAKMCSRLKKKPNYFFDMQGSLSGEIAQHNFVKKESKLFRLIAKTEKRINSYFPVITQSDNLYNKLLESGISKEKIVNAMDGANTELFFPRKPDVQLLEKYNISTSAPRIIFMGLLEEYQGADLLFKAFRSVCNKINNAQLIVIGFPNIEKYSEICKNYEILQNVHFVGKQKYEDCPKYLSLGEIAVAPKISLAEGDGKIYDYMSMGLPVVAFERSISIEILGDYGTYAKMGDYEDMARKIIYLIKNPENAKKLGECARERVKEFGIEKMAGKIENFYKKAEKYEL